MLFFTMDLNTLTRCPNRHWCTFECSTWTRSQRLSLHPPAVNIVDYQTPKVQTLKAKGDRNYLPAQWQEHEHNNIFSVLKLTLFFWRTSQSEKKDLTLLFLRCVSRTMHESQICCSQYFKSPDQSELWGCSPIHQQSFKKPELNESTELFFHFRPKITESRNLRTQNNPGFSSNCKRLSNLEILLKKVTMIGPRFFKFLTNLFDPATSGKYQI